MPRTREYKAEHITVRFDPSRCIHAAECVHGLPGVFEQNRRPWIDTGAGDADQIAQVIERCPTGALSYERHDGGLAERPPETPAIRVSPNGPLYLRGDLEIVGYDGVIFVGGSRVALCRCGASKNKPYCDNSHLEIGFRPDEENT